MRTSRRCALDAVAPGLLGLGGLVSEDSVRRGLRRVDQLTGWQWLTGHLQQSWWEFLTTPWILDVDTTIKPIYGRQEGARVGYNPNKPGRPSHALHTYWISMLRLLTSAEQLDAAERWRRILRRTFDQNFGVKGPEPPA